MLERNDAALPVVVALGHYDLPALQLDKGIFNIGDCVVMLVLVPDMKHVIGCSWKAAMCFFRCWMVMRT